MEMLLGLAVMALVPVYFVLQVLMVLRYSGAWRWATTLPLLLMVPAIVYSGVALAAESNLWPLAVIFGAPVSGVVLLVIGTLHRLQTGSFL